MLHVFPDPPEAVSAAWDPLAVLDSDGFDPDSILHDDDHSALGELIGAPRRVCVEVIFVVMLLWGRYTEKIAGICAFKTFLLVFARLRV